MASEDSLTRAQFQRVAENGDLIFAALGREFRIVIDDKLEQGILASKQIHEETQKPEVNPQRASIPISRIQAKVRAGEDIAQIAHDFAISEALVRRFARTVETERQYAIDQFLLASVPGALRRRTVHEVLADSLSKLDISMKSVQWTATRVDKAPWKIEAQFTLSGQTISAQWSWSFHDNAIAPLNATGGKLLRIARNEYDSPSISDLFELGKIGEAPAPVSYPPVNAPVRFDAQSQASIPAVIPASTDTRTAGTTTETNQSEPYTNMQTDQHLMDRNHVQDGISSDAPSAYAQSSRSADSWVFGSATPDSAATATSTEAVPLLADIAHDRQVTSALHSVDTTSASTADMSGKTESADVEPTQAITYRNATAHAAMDRTDRRTQTYDTDGQHTDHTDIASTGTTSSTSRSAFATNPLRPLRSSSDKRSADPAATHNGGTQQSATQINTDLSATAQHIQQSSDPRTSNESTGTTPHMDSRADSHKLEHSDEQATGKRKSRRSAVPSWQEILFGE